MSGPRTRILFIGGCGRSGTTLLGQILGQAEGFCFVGEAMYGWRSLSTRRCGCGVRASECDFWRAVRRQAGTNGAGAAVPDIAPDNSVCRIRA